MSSIQINRMRNLIGLTNAFTDRKLMLNIQLIESIEEALIVSDEQIEDVRPFIGRYHLEKGYIINQFPTYLTDLSECKLIIAHRPLTDAPILKGVPLINETYGGGEE